MIGHRFLSFNPKEEGKSKFEQLLDLFTQLLTYTNGDATEALDWLNQLDRQHKLTDNDYGIGDFIEDLKKKRIHKRKRSGRIFSNHGKI